MERYTRITVPLSKEEFTALSKLAQYDYRHPRDQARYLLRGILLGEQSDLENSKTAGVEFGDPTHGFAEVNR